MENEIVQTDAMNKYSWDEIRSFYQNDVLIARLVRNDNGTTAETSYEGGIRNRMIQMDNPGEASVKTWDRIETYYDAAGKIQAKVTLFDDGTINEQQFENGVRSQSSRIDLSERGGAKSWDRIDTYYDETGAIEARVTFFDNGIVREELFENGVRSQTSQIDNPQEEGVSQKPWERIDTYFDETGTIEARVIFYDNGVVREEKYVDGVKSEVHRFDNPQSSEDSVAAWTSISSYFDETGTIEARVTVYDDGRLRQDSFENGVLSATEIQDNAFTSGDGAYQWTAINMDYDENGAVETRTTIYDDARIKTESFEGGVRTETTIEDAFLFGGGKYDWDEKAITFDEDGVKASETVYFDNLDATQSLYENGTLVSQSSFDGDGSELWLGQTTFFNADGSIASVEDYANQQELPVDFFIPQFDDALSIA